MNRITINGTTIEFGEDVQLSVEGNKVVVTSKVAKVEAKPVERVVEHHHHHYPAYPVYPSYWPTWPTWPTQTILAAPWPPNISITYGVVGSAVSGDTVVVGNLSGGQFWNTENTAHQDAPGCGSLLVTGSSVLDTTGITFEIASHSGSFGVC